MTKDEFMEKRLRYLLESEKSEDVAYAAFDKEYSSEARAKLEGPGPAEKKAPIKKVKGSA